MARNGLDRIALILVIIGAIVCLIFLAGWMKTYFALLCLILALNFGLMLYFISHNDPSKRGKKEE